MAGGYQFSSDVRQLIGPQATAAIEKERPVYTCRRCQKQADSRTEDTSVIVLSAPNQPQVIQLAHRGCLPSQVIKLDHITPPVDDDPDDLITLAIVSDGTTLTPIPESLLVIDRPVPFEILHRDGDSVSLWLNLLLEDGWALAFPDRLEAPPVTSYRAHVYPDGSGQVHGPRKRGLAPFLDQLPPLPPGWLDVLRRTERLTILAGNIGLRDAADASAITTLLPRAVRAGKVAVARIPVTMH